MGEPVSLNEEIREIQKGVTIHRTEGEVLWASRGMEVCRSQDGGKSWQEDGYVSTAGWRRVVDPFPLMRRMSRGGIFGIWPQSDGARICVGPKMILRAGAGSSEYRCVFSFPRGSRPLNLCQGKDGRIYWGEYFLNLTRSAPVRIFGSTNGGQEWEVVYTFPKGSVCHVHRIVYDPYEDALLVCTGDRDPEVGIWKTTDGFRNLKPLVQGTQRYRTTSLIVRPQSILYGTDDPVGKNYIISLDRRRGTVEPIQEIPGPVLYACQVGEYAVFATMVEKKNHEITLWAGKENSFRLVMHFRARKMNQLWRELVGYGTVILPEGQSVWPNLFCTPVGTYDYSNRLLRINLQGTLVGFEDIEWRMETKNFVGEANVSL